MALEIAYEKIMYKQLVLISLLSLTVLLLLSSNISSNMRNIVEIVCRPSNLEIARSIIKGISTESLGYKLKFGELSNGDLRIYKSEFIKDTVIYAKALVPKRKILLSNSFFYITDVGYQRAVIIHEVGHIHYKKQFKFGKVPILDLPRKFADTFGQNAKYSNQISREFSYLTALGNIYNELWADKFLLDTYPNLFLKYALQDKYIKNDNIRLEKEKALSIVYCLNRIVIYSFWQNQFKQEDEVYKICAEMIEKYLTRLNEMSSKHNIDLTELRKLSSELVEILQNIDQINERYCELSKNYGNLIFDIYTLLESR